MRSGTMPRASNVARGPVERGAGLGEAGPRRAGSGRPSCPRTRGGWRTAASRRGPRRGPRPPSGPPRARSPWREADPRLRLAGERREAPWPGAGSRSRIASAPPRVAGRLARERDRRQRPAEHRAPDPERLRRREAALELAAGLDDVAALVERDPEDEPRGPGDRQGRVGRSRVRVEHAPGDGLRLVAVADRLQRVTERVDRGQHRHRERGGVGRLERRAQRLERRPPRRRARAARAPRPGARASGTGRRPRRAPRRHGRGTRRRTASSSPSSPSRTSSRPRAAVGSPDVGGRRAAIAAAPARSPGVEAGPGVERTRSRGRTRQHSGGSAAIHRSSVRSSPASNAARPSRPTRRVATAGSSAASAWAMASRPIPAASNQAAARRVEPPPLVRRQARAEVVGEQAVHPEPAAARRRAARGTGWSAPRGRAGPPRRLRPVIAAPRSAVKRSATAAADRSSRRPASSPAITSSPR